MITGPPPKLVVSLSTMLGPGPRGAMIWILDHGKLTEFLSSPEFAALRPRIALTPEN